MLCYQGGILTEDVMGGISMNWLFLQDQNSSVLSLIQIPYVVVDEIWMIVKRGLICYVDNPIALRYPKVRRRCLIS